MPQEIDLLYAFGLPPEKAIAYFKAKGYAFTWDWHEMLGAAHDKAFTVAKVMNQDILDDIRAMVQKALDEGISQHQFDKELMPILQAKGWWGKINTENGVAQLGSPRRLKIIYQTNLATSYSAGRKEAFLENAVDRPYWQYVAVHDAQTRPSHLALDGKVFPYDDPFWTLFGRPGIGAAGAE